MTYLSVENISKSFGLKPLFNNLTFGINKGDKIALVAPNGTGKSTLLKVLADKEPPDEGEVMTKNGLRIAFLEQEPELDNELSIEAFITRGHSELAKVIRNYEEAVKAQAENFNADTQRRFESAMAAMDANDAWDYEQNMKQILAKLDIHDLGQNIGSLSGGERKRVALAFVLLEQADLLLLDEPTNHLDLDMIEWLENYLAKNNITLFMVTHDRYFLDRVCNHILEIDEGKLYHHKGNYAYYLQKKAERKEVEQTQTDKAGQLLKKELEWMRRSPKARTTKSKSRIAAFYETEEKAKKRSDDPDLRLEVSMQRMGNKIVEAKKLEKKYGDRVILDDFSYAFSKGERIGIIGKNGVGKSTFLNILTGKEKPDSGEVETGTTIAFGHFEQKGIQIDGDKRVIDVLKDIASVIQLADGSRISASQFLEHFMFTPKMQYTPVEKLSGGERRRLALMMVLIQNPNFLILDEPTNDLDLPTMQRLEEFLLGFGGCLIIVSHDRFFMDKLVQHYFVFEGDGQIWDHNGTYLEYRALLEEREAAEKSSVPKEKPFKDEQATQKKTSNGLSYKEQKEYSAIEKEISKLEETKSVIEQKMSSGELELSDLQNASEEYAKIEQDIEEKTLRWMELAEKLES